MTGNPAGPSGTTAGLARWRTPIIWGLVAIGWALLFADTVDIHSANLDDVAFARWTANGHPWNYVRDWEQSQGRYYGFFAYTPIWLVESIKQPWLFQAVRLGFLVVTLWLLGRLAVKITGSTELRQLWWLLWIGVLQIPPTFYALLSYPYFHLGVIFMLLAALSFWAELEAGTQAGWPWRTGLLFFAGLQFHESFLVFSALIFALWFLRTPAGQRRATWWMLVPVMLACVVYVGIYFAYRRWHPPTYDGTQAGGDVTGMFVYLARYAASSLPGFELIIDRDTNHPALAGGAEIMRRLTTLNPWRIPWAIAVGAAAGWLLYTTTWAQSRWQSIRLAAGAAVMGLLCLSPPAFSAKYQAYAYRRAYPHGYNLIMLDFAWLAVAIIGLALVAALPRSSPSRRMAAVVLGVAVGLICLVAQITNPLSLEQIRKVVAAAS